MTVQIKFLFKAIDLNETVKYSKDRNIKTVLEIIEKKKTTVQFVNQLQDIRPFFRKQTQSGAYQYIPYKSTKLIEDCLNKSQHLIVVQFFHSKNSESIRSKIKVIDTNLQKRQRQLKYLINELKDDSSLFYAMQIISKTSRASYAQFQDEIIINIIISDPLVDSKTQSPLYYQQVDVSNRIQKLKQASLSDSSLLIQAKRYHANSKQLYLALAPQGKKKQNSTLICQLFTRVQEINGQIMMSLQNSQGQEIWENAKSILAKSQADLLIVVGIGVHLLEQIQYEKPLIMLTSLSIEEYKAGEPNYTKDRFALAFLQNLYQNIFKKQQLSYCINEARRCANEFTYNYLWCCCLHQHSNDCSWQQIVRKIGNQQAHRLFKHSFQQWKALKFYPINNALQEIILGSSNSTCSKDNICCWNRMNINKLQLHQNLIKLLIWNNKTYQTNFGIVPLKLNKFQSEVYDKPIHRTRPLTIYRIIKLVRENQISIIRARIVTQAKRLLIQAFQYIRCRSKQIFIFEMQVFKQLRIEKEIGGFIKNIKSTNHRLEELTLIISIIEKEGNLGYQSFMKSHQSFLQNIRMVYHIDVTLHFVIITQNPSFQGEYTTLNLNVQPDSKQKYYEILHNYKYQNISPDNKEYRANLKMLNDQILYGTAQDKIQIKERCQEIFHTSINTYMFLGFIALFEEDGFYLTKSTKIIAHQIFGRQAVEAAIKQKIPVQSFANCTFLQVPKAYRQYFIEVKNQLHDSFFQKQLQFYNILFKLYAQFLSQDAKDSFDPVLKSFLRRQGLFSINIDPQNNNYKQIVNIIRSSYKKEDEITEIFYNHTVFKPIYHLNQIEKILQFMNKNKKKMFQAIDILKVTQKELRPTILQWNIIQRLVLVLHTLQRQFQQKVKDMRMMIIIFLLKGESKHTIIQIAKIQLSLLTNQQFRKSDNIKHQSLSQFLTYFHLYSIKLSSLNAFKPQWGTTYKFKEVFYNCFTLVYKLKECLQTKKIIQEFKRFNIQIMIPQEVWQRQLMKLITKKILFYFNFIRMIKPQKDSISRVNEMKDFHKHLNLGQIRYQFQDIYLKLPEGIRKESNYLLMDRYIKISLNEIKVDSKLIDQLKQKTISKQLMVVYQYIHLKIDKKTMYSQKRLGILARTRSSFLNGKEYMFNRKRYLTVSFLKSILSDLKIHFSYFNFTTSILALLASINITQILFFIIHADSEDSIEIFMGLQSSIQTQKLSVQKFTQYLTELPIKILIAMGKNSIKVGAKIKHIYSKSQPNNKQRKLNCPIIISLSNSRFSMNDVQLNSFPPHSNNFAWEYLLNEIHLMGMDLIVLSIIYKISEQLKKQHSVFNTQKVTKIVDESIRNAKNILSIQFQSVQQTFNHFQSQILASPCVIDKIESGLLEDLTSKYYSSQFNLYHYKYYQNVGRCDQIYAIIESLSKRKMIVQITGKRCTGKTTILNEAAWTVQIKNLFQFGVFIFDTNNNYEEWKQFIINTKFKEKYGQNQSNTLICFDNLSEGILQQQRQIFEKLKGKTVTVMFTADSPTVGIRLRKILYENQADTLGNTTFIDLNKIQIRDIFGILLSNIKDTAIVAQDDKRYTKQAVFAFQRQVQIIMKEVSSAEQGTQIGLALKLLTKDKGITYEQKHQLFLDFYKKNYENLLAKLKYKKKIKLSIT